MRAHVPARTQHPVQPARRGGAAQALACERWPLPVPHQRAGEGTHPPLPLPLLVMMLTLRPLLLAACTNHPQPLLLQQQLLHPLPRAALAGAPPPLSCCRCPPLPSARSACSTSWPTWLMPLMPPPAAEGGGISLRGSGKCSLVDDGSMLLSSNLTRSYHPAAAHSAALGDQGQHGRAGGRSARCVRALVTREVCAIVFVFYCKEVRSHR